MANALPFSTYQFININCWKTASTLPFSTYQFINVNCWKTIPQGDQDSINHRLGGITSLFSAENVGVAIDAMFEGEVPAVDTRAQIFDYLEDPEVYKAVVKRALER